MRLIQCSLPKLNILSFDWASKYTRYLKGEIKSIGEIDNSRLATPDGTLKDEEFKQDSDYVLINHQVWEFIHARYGGGPELKLTLPSNIIILETPVKSKVQPPGDNQPLNDTPFKTDPSDNFKQKGGEFKDTYVPLA